MVIRETTTCMVVRITTTCMAAVVTTTCMAAAVTTTCMAVALVKTTYMAKQEQISTFLGRVIRSTMTLLVLVTTGSFITSALRIISSSKAQVLAIA